MGELKYKIGDEVLVRGVVKDTKDNCAYADKDRPYWIECVGGNGVWTRENAVYDLREMNDVMKVWKLAGEIAKMDCLTVEEIFGDEFDCENVFELSPHVVREKIDAYYRSKPAVGDIVDCTYQDEDVIRSFRGIYCGEDDSVFWTLVPGYERPRREYKSRWNIRKVKDSAVNLDSLCAKEED